MLQALNNKRHYKFAVFRLFPEMSCEGLTGAAAGSSGHHSHSRLEQEEDVFLELYVSSFSALHEHELCTNFGPPLTCSHFDRLHMAFSKANFQLLSQSEYDAGKAECQFDSQCQSSSITLRQ